MSNRDRALSNLTTMLNPGWVAPSVFPEAGHPYDLVEKKGVEAKFFDISSAISRELSEAAKSATTRKDDALVLRPWAENLSPEIRLAQIEKTFAVNEAMIEALVTHLADHVVIREELRSQAEAARHQASVENRRIPEYTEDFAAKLVLEGVVLKDVRFMSKARVGRVAALIRGFSEDVGEAYPTIADTAAIVPESDVLNAPAAEIGSIVPKSPSKVEDSIGRIELGISRVRADALALAALLPPSPTSPQSPSADARSSSIGSETDDAASIEGAIVDAKAGLDMPDMVSAGSPSPSLDERSPPVAEPVPPAVQPVLELPLVPLPAAPPPSSAPTSTQPARRWDVIDLGALEYEIVERPASSDTDTAALRMVLPDVSSMRELALDHGVEKTLADNVESYGALDLAGQLLDSWATRTERRLSEAERLVWLFLLVAVRDPAKVSLEDPRKLFDGIVLPGPAGSSRVREIRSKKG